MRQAAAIGASLWMGVASPAAAKDYQWILDSGPGDFSNPENWYDLDPAADPHTPSGPPGAGDTAEIRSGARVRAVGGLVSKLTGGSNAVFEVLGNFTVADLEAVFILKGSGRLTATRVPVRVWIEGGSLLASQCSARGMTVDAGGQCEINSLTHAAGDSTSVLVDRGSSLIIRQPVSELQGSIEGGSTATFSTLENTVMSKLTLRTAGVGSRLELSGFARIRDGSLDVASGARLTVAGSLILDGLLDRDGVLRGSTSRWLGAGSTISIGDDLVLGSTLGLATLDLGSGARSEVFGALTVAGSPGADSTLGIAEAGSVLHGFGGLALGDSGKGRINISGGAGMQLHGEGLVVIGREIGSEGALAVDGQGSHFLVPAGLGPLRRVVLGEAPSSQGTLQLNNRAAFVLGEAGYADFVVGRLGTGTVNGRSGSILSVTGSTTVALFAGSTGSISFGDGTIASLGDCQIGEGGNGEAHAFGTGTSVSCRSLFLATSLGSKGTLAVSPGAEWTSATTTVIGGGSGVGGQGSLTVLDNGSFRTGGLLRVAADGTLTVQSTGQAAAGFGPLGGAGILRIQNNGILDGTGQVKAKVQVAAGGAVEPGTSIGRLTIEGTYSQDANGVLRVEVGGLPSGTASDLLSITGAATLGGTLEVRLRQGYTPGPQDRITILQATSVTGTFARVLGADVVYSPTSVTIKPKAVPGGGPTVTSITPIPGGSIGLAWTSVPGTLYRVERSASLSGIWSALGAPITATGPLTQFIDTAPPSGSGFYRIVIP